MSEKQLRLYRETPPMMTSPSPLRLRLVPPIVRPRAVVAGEVPAVPTAPVAPVPVASLDDQIFAILDEPVPPGVTISCAFREKEQTLAAYFTTLSVGDARTLHRRLTIPSPDDALAVRFSRLVADRQARLVAVLADARRREAMSANRRV